MGFRVELRAKSNFKSNARGKLRQTIYFFWPYYCQGQVLQCAMQLKQHFCEYTFKNRRYAHISHDTSGMEANMT